MEPFLLSFFYYSVITAFVLAWILTTMLVYLILKKTEKKMKEYSHILLQSAIIDLIAVCVYAAFQVHIDVNGKYLFSRIGTTLFTFSETLQCAAPSFYGVAYVLAYTPIPFQYVYRYFIICKKYTFPLYFMLIVCCFTFFVMLGIATFYYFGWTPVEKNMEAKALLLNLTFWENVNGMERFCFCLSVNPNRVTYHVTMSSITIGGLIIIILISIRTFFFLKVQSNMMSKQTLHMHAQLGRRLILQTIIPAIVVLNTSLAITFPYLAVKNLYFFLIYPWISVMNCIATIMAIKSYRRTVFSWITFDFIRHPSSNNTSSESTSSNKLSTRNNQVANVPVT